MEKAARSRRFITRIAATLTVLTLGSSLSACTVEWSTSTSSDTQTNSSATDPQLVAAYNAAAYEDVADGGTLTTALPQLGQQQNIFHADAGGEVAQLWSWYNPQVMLTSQDGTYTPNPDYITSVNTTTQGNQVVTLTLNDKAVFNDNTPIDWTAIAATWKINNGEDPAFRPASTAGYEAISSVTAGETPKQAIITFNGTYPQWESLFTTIAHPTLTDPAVYNSYLGETMESLGAGPYTVSSVSIDSTTNTGTVTLTPNPQWWGKPGKLTERTFIAQDPEAAATSFVQGGLDAVALTTSEQLAAATQLPQGTQLRTSTGTTVSFLRLNPASPVFADPAVREAFAQAIDREAVANAYTAGLAASGVSSPEAEAVPTGSVISTPDSSAYRDNFAAVASTDPAKAGAALEAAGWLAGEDGMRSKDGKPLTARYTVFGNSQSAQEVANAIVEMGKAIGMTIELDNQDVEDFAGIVSRGDFDILPLTYTVTDPVPAHHIGAVYGQQGSGVETDLLADVTTIPEFVAPQIVAVRSDLANYGAFGFATVPVENVGYRTAEVSPSASATVAAPAQ
ncbi:MAG: ABC transporter family substrate-binding protein [Corynebacterium sp.]|nr:ABC transporter family substrate-binding protein [Corynebacterium sp.]